MAFTPLNGLHAFTVVARLRSFSAAARELGVSTSALSQAVRQLEERLGVVLLTRTTRSVATTKEGIRLLERSGPALEQALAGLRAISDERDGEIAGLIRLSVPEMITELVLAKVIPEYLAAHPKAKLEIVVDSARVDIVRDGYDAGVRSENIPKDMVRLRLTSAYRLVVVAAPSYLARYGEPKKPEDVLRHRTIGMSDSAGKAWSWELERGKRLWKLPITPAVVCNDRRARMVMAETGVGLAYAVDLDVAAQVAEGKLRVVLDDYAAKLPGSFLYYPSRRQTSPAFRAFLEMLRTSVRE